jgi:uncharacterized protein
MGKLLTWVLIGLAAWAVWRMWTISRRRIERSRADAAGAGGPNGPPGRGGGDADPDRAPRVGAPERMMRCAVCGLYLPGSEVTFARGKVFCSAAHRDAPAAEAGRGDG